MEYYDEFHLKHARSFKAKFDLLWRWIDRRLTVHPKFRKGGYKTHSLNLLSRMSQEYKKLESEKANFEKLMVGEKHFSIGCVDKERNQLLILNQYSRSYFWQNCSFRNSECTRFCPAFHVELKSNTFMGREYVAIATLLCQNIPKIIFITDLEKEFAKD